MKLYGLLSLLLIGSISAQEITNVEVEVGSNRADVQFSVEGLTPGSEYPIDISVMGPDGEIVSEPVDIETKGRLVDPESIKAENVDSTSAVIAWDSIDGIKHQGQVEYGLTTDYGSFSVKEESFRWPGHRQALSGLKPGTEYNFRVIATAEGGEPEVSENYTFETEALPFLVSDVQIERVTDTTAIVFWRLNDYGTGQVFYGRTEEMTNFTGKEESFRWDAHRQTIDGLEQDTEYSFYVVSEDQQGREAQSEVFTFKTAKKSDQPVGKDGINNIPVAGWPSNFDNDLPMGNVFYGNHEVGILTGNARIGVELSRRFRAERTGYIDAVRWNNRTLSGTNIAGRCLPSAPNSVWCKCKNAGLDKYTCGYTLGNSYSIGNGGQILIEIREDDGSNAGLPRSGAALGQASRVFIPMDNANTHYPIVELEKPVPVTAGKTYHIVYRNLAPPSRCGLSGVSLSQARSCPRNEGAIGLNGVFFPNTFDNVGFDPFRGRADAVLYKSKVGGVWQQDSNNLSWYEVRYTDDVWVGDGTAAYNSIFHGARHYIGGNKVGRQVFTVRDASREVDGLWIYHGHGPSADGSPMTIVLKDSGGKIIGKGSVAANRSCIAESKKSSWAQKECRLWSYTAFRTSVDLIEGRRYSVEFSAGSRGFFALSSYFPLDYGSYQSKERGFWDDAQAEISSDNGRSWSGWAGNYYSKRDLGLLFTIKGMPRKLD